MNVADRNCQVCGVRGLESHPDFADFCRITSDCRPFRIGGDLATCGNCGAVQKLPTDAWRTEIAEIYSGYEAYHQANGDEQIVFDPVEGRPRRRSDVLLDRFASASNVPESGRMLDVGCGGGATLRAMSAHFPRWRLFGHELSDRQLSRLAFIPGFERLYTGALDAIDASFDIVTMIHAIEHFEDPADVASILRRKLAPDGHFIVQVCDIERNPFDILVADHLMHFSPSTLARLAARAGFEVEKVATDWVSKEISLVARPRRGNAVDTVEAPVGAEAAKHAVALIRWLHLFRDAAREARSAAKRFGIFGTSIAGTWLLGELHGNVDFFVDEDGSRVGQTYLGKTVIHPSDVPAGSEVFLALAPSVALVIHRRLSSGATRYVLPPDLQ